MPAAAYLDQITPQRQTPVPNLLRRRRQTRPNAKLIGDIKTRLDVAERVLAHETLIRFVQPIPIDTITEQKQQVLRSRIMDSTVGFLRKS